MLEHGRPAALPYCCAFLLSREMIASLNIGAAVHGTVDDNMAVHAVASEGSGNQGNNKRGVCPTPARVPLSSSASCLRSVLECAI